MQMFYHKVHRTIAGKKRGFTILELIIVIGMIAILATLVVSQLIRARKSSRDTRRLADMAIISKAMELHYHDWSSSASPYTNCAGLVTGCTNSDATGLGQYIQAIATKPSDPSNSTVPCTGTAPASGSCNYAFPTPWNGSITDYTVYFYTELPLKATASRCNKQTRTGITSSAVCT